MRNLAQQIVNQRNYLKCKEMVNQILDNEDLRQTIQAVFMEREVPTNNKCWYRNEIL